MKLEAGSKRYRAVLRDAADLFLDSDKVSYEVSYLKDSDVEKTGHVPADRGDLKSDFEKAHWGDKGAQCVARIKPGTEVIVMYLYGDLCHIMGSDDPNSMRVVGETTLSNLRNIAPLGQSHHTPQSTAESKKLARSATFSLN